MTDRSDRAGEAAAETVADSWHEETIPIRPRSTPAEPDVSSVGRIEAPSTEAPDFSEMTVPMRPAFAPPSAPEAPDLSETTAPSQAAFAPPSPEAPELPSVPSAPSTPSAPSAAGAAALGSGAVGALVPGAAGVLGAVQTAAAIGSLAVAGIEAIAGAIAGASEPALPTVRYTFYPDDHADVEWKVRSVRCTQALSSLYELQLGLAVHDLIVNPEELLGASCELIVEREVLTQRVAGIITRVAQIGLANGHQLVDVRVAPALEALTHRFDFRIFQEKSVPEIVKQVMAEGLESYERTVRLALTREYPKREYTVQLGESDYDFCTRLLAEEGITFFFDPTTEREEVVLVDAPEPFEPVETMDGSAVQLAPAGAELRVESVRTFDVVTATGTTSVVTRDYDWTAPGLDVTGESRGRDPRDRDLEAYEYGGASFFAYSEGQRTYGRNDVGPQARLAREARAKVSPRFRGTGDVTGFLPGRTFELKGHARGERDARYLVTSVVHEGACPEVVITDQDGVTAERDRYRMSFECMPAEVAFRPKRRARPRVYGVQTAIVVGPEGEEIHTDPHGRIKVQFHWDREGERNERSSCWIRVAQTWGGAAWGFTFIPRIGMEVIVAFVDGNPDRPIVVGCVHNGVNPHPRDLPGEKTRSVIRTATTPGGPSAGHNELSFEDAAGNEEVYLFAQKNLREEVQNDHATTVGANQSNAVTGDRSTSVSGSHSESVSGGQSVSVGGTRGVSVTGDQTHTLSANRTATISSNDTLTVGGTRGVDVTGQVTETYKAGHRRKVTGRSHHSTVGERIDTVTTSWLGKADVQLQLRQGPTTITMAGTNVTVDAAGNVEIKNPGCSLKISGGELAIEAAASVSIKVGGSEIKLTDGNIEVVGASNVKVESGGSSVSLTPGGIESSAGAISSTASGGHVIGGSPVEIN
ncbi:MAG: type VI secretion system tip protein VgrG [Deltaproteobacteria bacterium]|nr:type VI secretion system tip protein VgrG [Deltaproteobacteria bacterium]